jgi:hypothetical protein
MQIKLSCPGCPFCFAAAAEADADDILERMTEEGPWIALGHGDTFEAMVFAALTVRGRIGCPDCGRDTTIHEGSAELPPRRAFACR